MKCDEVRDLLPEHLLGSLDDTTDARVRRHLRGCAECRAERLRLEDGVATLSYATHEATPPDDLRDHVVGVLRQEWAQPEAPAPVTARASVTRSIGMRWLATAAAAMLVVSIGWAAVQNHRADGLSADAASYQALLATLGGREFRLGELHTMGDVGISGTVLLYDGDKGWNSWGVVLARSDADLTDARAMLVGDNGSRELPPLRFSEGEASSWLVTHDDLMGYDELIITARDGTVLAHASISEA
jgi:hypothetical protein